MSKENRPEGYYDKAVDTEITHWPPYVQLPPVEHILITTEELAKKRDKAFNYERNR